VTCLERACAVARGGVIGVADLPPALRELVEEARGDLVPTPARPTAPAGTHTVHGVKEAEPAFAPAGVVPRPTNGAVSLENYERMCLLAALEDTAGDKIKAAKLLGVGKSTLYRKLKSHGIT
jgi:two-component system response regulator HydG